MATQDLEAIAVAKKLARQFGALAQLEGACERIEGLVAHETELVQRVEALKKQLQELMQKRNVLIVEIEQKAKVADEAHKAKLAEHSKVMSEAQSATDAAKKTSEMLIASFAKDINDAQAQHQATVDGLKATTASIRKAAEIEHQKRLDVLKADQSKIIEQTAQLRNQLSELKSKLSPFLAQ